MISAMLSLNILVMHVTKITFSFFAKLDMLVTTIGLITIGTCMWGTIFGLEIFMIKRTSACIESTRDKTYNYSSFLNVDHALNVLKIYKLRASFHL